LLAVPGQPIPLADTKAQYAPLIPEIRRAFDEVLESSAFVFGPNVKAFEEEAAAYLGVPETIGVANGTDAIVIALDALGVGRGDEVICPAFTFFATAEAIARTGATPVFAEIDPQTLVLDAEDAAARVTNRTKAIVPVHLFGRPAPLDRLAELGLPLVEDAAQAFGSPVVAGTGIASTFSFYPSKNLFGLGDGGLIACRDAELAERIRMLRFHGSKAKRVFEYVGYNSRLDELQAAALRIFLGRLDGWTARGRRALPRARPRRLPRAAAGRSGPRLPPVRLPLPRARPHRRRARRGADRHRHVLRPTAPPPAGAPRARLRAGLVPGH
jgi:dTDP-3-amino-3,4,6-trideoxy-alpha-D-glucose transaminase